MEIRILPTFLVLLAVYFRIFNRCSLAQDLNAHDIKEESKTSQLNNFNIYCDINNTLGLSLQQGVLSGSSDISMSQIAQISKLMPQLSNK